MVDPLPLYIHSTSRPTPEQMEALKRAKQESGITELVKPARAFPGCERALVFGEGRPDFVCEWANTHVGDPKMAAKVKWVLTGLDGHPHSMAEWFSIVMDGEVKEVS